MSKLIYYAIALLIIPFVSCKNGNVDTISENKAKVVSEGLYINQTLLDSMNQNSIWWEMPRLAEQITILKGDTMLIDNYIEEGNFHFSYLNDSVIKVDQLMYGAAFTFHIHNESQLHLTDTLNFKNGETMLFAKSEKGFQQLMNEKLIAGNYSVLASKEKKTVVFSADGSIKDWNYNKYELCYAGDCAEMPADPANIIVLYAEKGIEFMTIKIEKRNDGRYVILNKLKEGSPDEKGNMQLAGDSIVLKNIY
jgi:hypothetical protein